MTEPAHSETTYHLYEREKAKLEFLSPEEYQAALQALAERLGI